MKRVQTSLPGMLMLLAALVCGAPKPSRAADVLGTYECTVEVGAVLLDGTYPIFLGDIEGSIDLRTSPAGKVSGVAHLLGFPFALEGAIKTRARSIRLVLAGSIREMPFRIHATLKGGSFVGLVTLGRLRYPCQFDVRASGALRPRYLLTMSQMDHGVLSGTGVLRAARQDVPLTLQGVTLDDGTLQISARGPNLVLKMKDAVIDAGTITADHWVARAFGASRRGVHLRCYRPD